MGLVDPDPQIHLSGIVDPESGSSDPPLEIVDPDPGLEQGSKWIRLRIRPNVVDPDPKPCFIKNFPGAKNKDI